MGEVKAPNDGEIAMAISFHAVRRDQPELFPIAKKVYEQRKSLK